MRLNQIGLDSYVDAEYLSLHQWLIQKLLLGAWFSYPENGKDHSPASYGFGSTLPKQKDPHGPNRQSLRLLKHGRGSIAPGATPLIRLLNRTELSVKLLHVGGILFFNHQNAGHESVGGQVLFTEPSSDVEPCDRARDSCRNISLLGSRSAASFSGLAGESSDP